MSDSIQQKVEAILHDQYPLQNLAADDDLPEIVRQLRTRQLDLETAHNEQNNFFDTAPVGCLTLTETGLILKSNPAGAEMLQQKAEDLHNKSLAAYLDSDSQPILARHLKAVFTSGRREICELSLKTAGSAKTYLRLRSVARQQGDRRLCHTIITDITGRKEIELSLQESEALNRAIFNSLSANIAVLNGAGEIIAVNENWLDYGRQNGVVDESLIGIGVNYLDVCKAAAGSDPSSGQVFDGIRAVLVGEQAMFTADYPLEAPDQIHWFTMRVIPLSSQQPGVVVTHEDITEHKQLEETLRENVARFRLLTEKASDLIALHEPDGRYLYLSPSCERLLGYKPEELVGQSPYELFHPEDIARIQAEAHDRARRGSEIASVTYRIRHKSGEYIWFETYTQPVHNKHGQVTRLITASRDVTERKQAEEELRAIQERLYHVTSASPAVIYMLEIKGDAIKPVWISDYGVHLLGYTLAEMLEPDWWAAHLHPKDREQALAAMATLFDNDHLIHEYRFQRKDGAYIWIRDELRLLRDEAGRPIEAIGAWADTTRRKQAELALQEERGQLAQRVKERTAELVRANQQLLKTQQTTEALYEFGRVLMASKDTTTLLNTSVAEIAHILPADRVYIYLLNLQTRQVTGFAKGGPNATNTPQVDFAELWAGLTGWVIRERQPALIDGKMPDPRESEAVRQRRAELQSGPTLVVPLEYKGQIMGTLTAVKSVGKMPFANDELALVQSMVDQLVVALRNLSLTDSLRTRSAELSTANSELARAARLKDEFLANMSHELRTPLNAILGMSEVLQMETFGNLNDQQQGYIKHIEDGGRHLLSLINDILDLSKIEAGRLELDLETTPVKDVCQASLLFVKQQALSKRLKLDFQFDETIETLEVDERRLKQILVNLLTNAVKFTPSGGQMGLDVSRDTERSAINFSVWDTGIGISDEDLQKLFQPFVQLDSSLAREQEGTGLGLSLVYRLAKLHGGSVAVESQVGQGSRFTVSIPWRSIAIQRGETGPSAEETPAPAAVSSLPRPVILLAEDNPANITLVRDLLRAHNYHVILAENGYEAVEQARAEQPALILMDIQMPGLDGLEAIRRIRADSDKALVDVPIIALTALAMIGDKERCIEAGANAYLSKPANMKQLLELIDEFLVSDPTPEQADE